MRLLSENVPKWHPADSCIKVTYRTPESTVISIVQRTCFLATEYCLKHNVSIVKLAIAYSMSFSLTVSTVINWLINLISINYQLVRSSAWNHWLNWENICISCALVWVSVKLGFLNEFNEDFSINRVIEVGLLCQESIFRLIIFQQNYFKILDVSATLAPTRTASQNLTQLR